MYAAVCGAVRYLEIFFSTRGFMEYTGTDQYLG